MSPLKMIKTPLLASAAWFALAACGGNDAPANPPPAAGSKVFSFDLNGDAASWTSGFSDYPEGSEVFYELAAGPADLPASLGAAKKGYRISGNNHSDDLFMFVKKQIHGLEPVTRYQLQFELTVGTNAQSGCMGVGGAPGEGVTVKAGASAIEPMARRSTNPNRLSMNIDKGEQTRGGVDAITVGNLANGVDCGSDDTSHHPKTLDNVDTAFTATSDANGNLWILWGTDSGYEATTTVYYLSGKVTATKAN